MYLIGSALKSFLPTRKVKISIDPEEQPAVKALIQLTLDTLRPEKLYANKHLDVTFLCSQSPAVPICTAPEDVFMPLFPRRRHIGTSNVEFADFKGLMEKESVSFEQVKVVNIDDDISHQNLVLVDGWRELPSKSAPAWICLMYAQ